VADSWRLWFKAMLEAFARLSKPALKLPAAWES
jgi:hypothetical protein